jgi:O-antigen ligase
VYILQRISPALLVILSALIAFVVIEMPRALSFLPGVLAIISLGVSLVLYRAKPRFPLAAFAAVFIISGLSLVSVLWSINPEISLERALNLIPLLVLGGALIAWSVYPKFFPAPNYFLTLAFIIIFGSLLAAIELNFGQTLYKVVRGMPSDGHVPYAVYNRGTVILILTSLIVLPYFLYIQKNIKFSVGMMVPVFALMWCTDSQSAQLALGLGLLTLFAFPYASKAAWVSFGVIVASLILMAPFISPWLYNYADVINALPFLGSGMGYAGPRLEIWDYVGRYALDSPLFGYGIEATRTITDFDSKQIYIEGNTILHPHNFALQLWIEFGVIGALCGAAFTSTLFWFIAKTPNLVAQRASLSCFIAALSISATGYGIWQSWWLGALFFAAANALCLTRETKNINVIRSEHSHDAHSGE